MASSRTPGSSFVKSSYAASNASCQNLGNLLRRLLVYTSHMCFTTFSLSSISCFHKNPPITKPLTVPHICTKIQCQNSGVQTERKRKKQTRTSRSSWMWESRSSEIWLRLPADHRRVTVPVNIDQKARSRIAANAQNLYRPLPKTLASELSFFAFVVGAVVGRESSSFIATSPRSHRFSRFGFEFQFDQTLNPKLLSHKNERTPDLEGK